MKTKARKAERPPLEGVLREAPFSLRSDDDGGEQNDGLTLDGYGAVFNRETIIDSWEGKFKEKIAPGSMKRSFRETPPRIQFDHGRHPMIGSIPIAKIERIAEEVDPELAPEGGAHVIARIFDNWLMQPVRDAIEAQAVDGMSFRFGVVREQWQTADGKVIRDDEELMAVLRATWYEDVPDEELPLRTLKELKVPEMGPVVWPAYADTSVSVRSKVIDLGRLHEPEQRKLLAQAVFIADAAEQDDDAQRDTGDPVVERPAPSAPSEAEPRADAQQSTGRVGERPSKQSPVRDIDLVLRNQRDSLITHKSKEYNRVRK
ncbi:capsid maturation protease [Gordonia phage Eyre]|uniref:Capsid maturation protease n=1 Tax=Gordonia phage Eyre TaxID=1887646 RepID=A0A1B3AZV4_9CAUD|nr:head maturation protease [Gordonia phage Eyre]AOE44285.1 capsid maturation protease [Gordonia phage Eyre]